MAAGAQGRKVRFFRVTKLITLLLEAKEEQQLLRVRQQLGKLDLLILDELGYVPASKAGAELLFDTIATAYEQNSLIVTTDLPFENWTGSIPMQVDKTIAEILKREGTEYLFCFPTTPIIDACSEAGIRPLVARQERVAGNMADGFSRMTNGRRMGVCSFQAGAGAENCFSGITQAFTDSSPVLFVIGQWDLPVADLSPHFNSPRNYRHATKWAERTPTPAMTETYLRKSYSLLRSGRPRPVLLELCRDMAQESAPELSYAPPPRFRSAADPTAVEQAVTLLLEAERPVIWAGQGVLYAEASGELSELAERLGAPVTTTLLGKSAFNERHPLALGTASFSKTAMVAAALEEADVLFSVGASLSRDFTAAHIPPGKRHVQCSVDPDDLNTYFPLDVGLVGDARLVLQQMLDDLADRRVDRSEARARREGVIERQRSQWDDRWAAKRNSDAT
ncbi:MAG: thiamine pyrophosphate-binding protein, partial [Bythopirellula sp.]